MSGDLISREALLNGFGVNWVHEFDETGSSIRYKAVSVEAIKNAPAVDAEPVRHGSWGDYVADGYDGLRTVWARPCSECGYTYRGFVSNYCPNCGADMRGKNVSERNNDPETVD